MAGESGSVVVVKGVHGSGRKGWELLGWSSWEGS